MLIYQELLHRLMMDCARAENARLKGKVRDMGWDLDVVLAAFARDNRVA